LPLPWKTVVVGGCRKFGTADYVLCPQNALMLEQLSQVLIDVKVSQFILR